MLLDGTKPGSPSGCCDISTRMSRWIIALLLPLTVAGCANNDASSEHLTMTEEVVKDAPLGSAVASEDRTYLYSERLATGVSNQNTDLPDYTAHAPADDDVQFSDEIDLGSIDSGIKLRELEAPPEEKMTLDLALSNVWGSHPNVSRALSELEATGFDISGARTGYYPYLSISATEASNDASATTLNVIQPIWSGGRVSAQVQEAEAEQKRALANLNQVRLDLALQTTDAYLNVLQAEEQGRLWARYIGSLEVLLGIIQRRSDNGVSPPVDIQTALTRLSQAQAGLAANRANLIRSRLSLETLIYQSVPPLKWPGSDYRLSQPEVTSILNDQSISSHPSGQLALAEIAVQRAQAKAAKAGMFPQLSLQYQKQLDQSDGDFTPDSSTRLVLEYATDGGLRGYAGYRAVQQRLQGAQQDLIFARRDVTDQISAAYAEREVAQQQFASQVGAAEASVKLVDSFLRQFKVGRKQWIEVLNAHREAHEALLQITAIRRNFWSANMRLAIQGMVWERLSSNVPNTYLQFED